MPSESNKLSIHANAVNLARRYSVQNENDLMQEDMHDNSMDLPSHSFDHDHCLELSKHLMHFKSLPQECLQYKDITSDLKRREADTTDPTSLLS